MKEFIEIPTNSEKKQIQKMELLAIEMAINMHKKVVSLLMTENKLSEVIINKIALLWMKKLMMKLRLPSNWKENENRRAGNSRFLIEQIEPIANVFGLIGKPKRTMKDPRIDWINNTTQNLTKSSTSKFIEGYALRDNEFANKKSYESDSDLEQSHKKTKVLSNEDLQFKSIENSVTNAPMQVDDVILLPGMIVLVDIYKVKQIISPDAQLGDFDSASHQRSYWIPARIIQQLSSSSSTHHDRYSTSSFRYLQIRFQNGYEMEVLYPSILIQIPTAQFLEDLMESTANWMTSTSIERTVTNDVSCIIVDTQSTVKPIQYQIDPNETISEAMALLLADDDDDVADTPKVNPKNIRTESIEERMVPSHHDQDNHLYQLQLQNVNKYYENLRIHPPKVKIFSPNHQTKVLLHQEEDPQAILPNHELLLIGKLDKLLKYDQQWKLRLNQVYVNVQSSMEEDREKGFIEKDFMIPLCKVELLNPFGEESGQDYVSTLSKRLNLVPIQSSSTDDSSLHRRNCHVSDAAVEVSAIALDMVTAKKKKKVTSSIEKRKEMKLIRSFNGNEWIMKLPMNE